MSQMPTAARPSVPTPTTRPAASGHTPHVLIADADAASRQEREQHLRAAGARVLTARTGFEAIVKASCQLPDLIVLDESLGDRCCQDDGQDRAQDKSFNRGLR